MTVSKDNGNTPEAIAEADAKAWIPTKGDFIEGTIVHIQMGGKLKAEGGLGRYPIVEFCASAGLREGEKIEPGSEVAIHAFHSTLAVALKDMRAQPGDEIRVRYDGQTKAGGHYGKGYHIYKVRPMNPRPFDWGNVVREVIDDDDM